MKANESITSSTYSIDGLQQSSWSNIWGPQGLEYANKNSGALTQNFSTDLRGRILSMTYTSATYSGELYFHYDALGNTTLLTDANDNPKASFQYDLHTGRLINSWNPSNLEIINLNDGITGSINLTAIRAPGLGKDITIQPYPPVKIGGSTNGDNWGSIHIAPDGARMVTDLTHVSRFGKDCGDMYQSLIEIIGAYLMWKIINCMRGKGWGMNTGIRNLAWFLVNAFNMYACITAAVGGAFAGFTVTLAVALTLCPQAVGDLIDAAASLFSDVKAGAFDGFWDDLLYCTKKELGLI